MTPSACFKWKYLNTKAQIFISLMFTSNKASDQRQDQTTIVSMGIFETCITSYLRNADLSLPSA